MPAAQWPQYGGPARAGNGAGIMGSYAAELQHMQRSLLREPRENAMEHPSQPGEGNRAYAAAASCPTRRSLRHASKTSASCGRRDIIDGIAVAALTPTSLGAARPSNSIENGG